ncbi:hypothetical protein NG819_19685 [Pseudarthrobacter sp. Fe7]|nr:hypothetical protein NG819_19685 [Pseudarthrobacter sp. Fe7]
MAVVGRPVIKVFTCGTGESVLAFAVAEAEQHVIQDIDQLLPAQVALIWTRERGREKRQCQGRILGAEQ